jgi:hypothetical protein
MTLMVCCEVEEKEKVLMGRGRGRIKRKAVGRETELIMKSRSRVNQE